MIQITRVNKGERVGKYTLCFNEHLIFASELGIRRYCIGRLLVRFERVGKVIERRGKTPAIQNKIKKTSNCTRPSILTLKPQLCMPLLSLSSTSSSLLTVYVARQEQGECIHLSMSIWTYSTFSTTSFVLKFSL